MARRPEVTGKKIIHGDEESDACSIATFCRRHGFSVAKYYELKAEGRGPVESEVDGRIIITRENQDAWRRSLPTREQRPEAATTARPSAPAI